MYCTTVGLQCIEHILALFRCVASSDVCGLEQARRINANFVKEYLYLWNPNTSSTLKNSFFWLFQFFCSAPQINFASIGVQLFCPQKTTEIWSYLIWRRKGAFVHSTECWVKWKIWNIPSNSNIGFGCMPPISHFDSSGRARLSPREREGGREGGTKAILRKTDVARPKGSTRHCWGLFYAFYSSSFSPKFLPQMILFILQILAPSYQNSQLAPSEGHFLATAPVACVASSSSRRH